MSYSDSAIGFPEFRVSSKPQQHTPPVLGRRPAPHIVERTLGRLRGPINVGRTACRTRRDHRLGRRIEYVECLAARRIGELPADEHLEPPHSNARTVALGRHAITLWLRALG
jgi:hypothetical protein